MKNNRKHGILVLIIIALIALLSAFSTFVPGKNGKRTRDNTNPEMHFIFNKKKDGYIAAIKIQGVIQEANNEYNQEWLLGTIDELKKDKSNLGIALFIDSPGGAVYQADEAYLALQDYKTSGKPVWAYQGSLAASGGYYISCAADKIYANRNTLTGSIGVITGSSYDLTGLFEKLGIKSETVHAGKNKNMFNVNEPVTEEQREIMQSLADEAYDQFTGIVAMSRNIPVIEVKKIADGRIYSAAQALKNGLIDGIDSWDGMIKQMKDNCFGGNDNEVIWYNYEYNPSLWESVIGACFGKGERKAISGELSKLSMRYPAYLYE